MRSIGKGILGTALVLSLCMVAGNAQAAALTQGQVNAIVSLLQSFGADASVVSSVQATLTGAMATGNGNGLGNGNTGDNTGNNMGNGSGFSGFSGVGSTTAGTTGIGNLGHALCIVLTRNLGVGSHGEDVMQLQQLLSQDPSSGFNSQPTGYFGSLTASSVANFQVSHHIAPANASLTGNVGPLTREFFDHQCNGGGNGEGNMGNGLGNGSGIPGFPGTGSSTFPGFPSTTTIPGLPGDGRMITILVGTVTANNGSTITVNAMVGGSKTVNVTASTTIQVISSTTAPTTGVSSDLSVGKMVTVSGFTNQDGTVTANHIAVGAVVPPPMTIPGVSSTTIPGMSGNGNGFGNGNNGNGMGNGQGNGGLSGGIPALCVQLDRNIGVGSQGNDVMQLQQFLSQDPASGFNSQPTGYFGALTADAVMRLQLNHHIASTTTGNVGPLTRQFFDHLCETISNGVSSSTNSQ